MKARLLVIFALAVLGVNTVHSEVTTLAVLDFDNNSVFHTETYSSLSRGLSQMMISALDPLQSVEVVERQKLSDLIDEIKMAQSGFGSDEALRRIGQMSGAKHLVFGSFMVSPDDKIRIDVRLVEVESGKTVKAEEITGPTKKILDLIDKLSLKFVQNLELELSNNEKALLSASVDVPMQAVVAYSQGLAFEDNKQDKEACLEYQKAVKIAPKFDEAERRLDALIQRVKNQ
jgi:TolB-like protein